MPDISFRTLENFLRSCSKDLEIICSDGTTILHHRIFLGLLCELWAELLLQNEVQSEKIITIFVPSDGETVREALSKVYENPDEFVDILFGKTALKSEEKYEIETGPLKLDKDLETFEPGYIGDYGDFVSDHQEEKAIRNKDKHHEETKEICEICNDHFFPKNMETHKMVHVRKKAEKEQRRVEREQRRQKKIEKLERIKYEKLRKRKQRAEIRRKEKEELVNLKREQKPEIYTCESCGKNYSRKLLLDLHRKRMHSEPIKCPNCDYKSTYQDKLKKHMKQHEGIIYETCHICSKKYIGPKNLRAHVLKRHEKREKTICPEPTCGKSILVHYINLHLRYQHSQERKVQCNDCDYKARDNYNMKLHRGKMHEDNLLVKEQCNHCDVQTTSMSNHIKQFHPDIHWNFENKSKDQHQQ